MESVIRISVLVLIIVNFFYDLKNIVIFIVFFKWEENS